MTLGGDDAQTAVGLGLFVGLFPVLTQGSHFGLALLLGQGLIGFDDLHFLFDVAAQNDLGAATSHVGGDRDHAGATGLGHDVGLTGMLLGVEHLVLKLGLRQQLGNQLGVLDRAGAHQ